MPFNAHKCDVLENSWFDDPSGRRTGSFMFLRSKTRLRRQSPGQAQSDQL